LSKAKVIALHPQNFFVKRLDKPMFLDYTDLSEEFKYPENYIT